MVNTGATRVSMGRSDVRRLGIDISRAQKGTTHTANGIANVWLLTLDSVTVGNIKLAGVPATVHETDMSEVLLGMSVLKRMEMVYEGSNRLRLRKKY
jgi:aspartyl protease family protein